MGLMLREAITFFHVVVTHRALVPDSAFFFHRMKPALDAG